MPQPKEGEVLVHIDDEDLKVGRKENAHLFTRRDMVGWMSCESLTGVGVTDAAASCLVHRREDHRRRHQARQAVLEPHSPGHLGGVPASEGHRGLSVPQCGGMVLRYLLQPFLRRSSTV